MNQPYLTHTELEALIVANLNLYHTKVKEHIKYKLKITEQRHIIEDLVMDIICNILERHKKGLICFLNAKKVDGYILFGCWCNYRSANVKARSKVKKPMESWMEEVDAYYPEVTNRKQERTNTVSLDDIRIQELANPINEISGQQLTDEYYSELYEKLWNYLDDCVADSFFKFDEVNIYKQYILNSWTKKKMVEESDFKRSYVHNALKKIQEHLQTVNWYIKQEEIDDTY